eukprot:COSAG06_NODE_15358_length_1077_cov_1.123722_2_plen_54_part_01
MLLLLLLVLVLPLVLVLLLLLRTVFGSTTFPFDLLILCAADSTATPGASTTLRL